MVKKTNQKLNSKLESLSKKTTHWIGTPYSIAVHTILFIGIFLLRAFGFTVDQILLILTTVVSLEAIYLAIFIQMTVNRNTESLEAVEDDIEDIQEDVQGLEDDVEEISEDVEDISEDIDQIQTEEEKDKQTKDTLHSIGKQLQIITEEIATLKKKGLL